MANVGPHYMENLAEFNQYNEALHVAVTHKSD